MDHKDLSLNASCVHLGELEDPIYKGAVSPLYMSSSYAYEDVDIKRYPRYFNTPNQEALAKKIAGLEHSEAGLIFGSGMAAISTSMLAFLSAGDHVVLQNTLYGGTYNFIKEEFERFGIQYTFTNGLDLADFKAAIQKNTKLIYIETPSNPLLTITDLAGIASLSKEAGVVSMIDNTFASPVNQNPADFGIDVILHSATKYMGGHSDICAGAVAASQAHIDQIFRLAKNLGGSLSDYTVWLLERSIKTMGIRVAAHNQNAMDMALYLQDHPRVSKVYYPGLESHPDHALAASQMKGFGGMLSFELEEGLDAAAFQKALQLIKPSMSLAGVESTLLSPTLTSHALLGAEERAKQGIADGLIRFSVGIEESIHLKQDIDQAIAAIS
ncbi:MAG: PLP-dependent aspartate aminotransferase family protein [Flavobacteriaceae bacterium]|nr:PLP-dependent aspartate aminotransferase family protein [Flavobacteriaceae bacterium]MCI5088524.1 PLP-dependent aspartate aminotransferase family protein [Flavobacteriaceae bacterium]CAI8175135.1 MAG: Cystathionine gamma-synthase [SAR116 cluster bacterium]